jgi:hypothetical protein
VENDLHHLLGVQFLRLVWDSSLMGLSIHSSDVPVEIRHEPLILEAAQKAREKVPQFFHKFLFSSATPTARGGTFEYIAAFTFMRYLNQTKLEENPLLTNFILPEGFKGKWIPFPSIFGIFAPPPRPRLVGDLFKPEDELFYEWFQNCMIGGESQYPGMLFPSNQAGPDTCMTFYSEDDKKKILFVLKQTKFSQRVNFLDSVATIDPELFFNNNRVLTPKQIRENVNKSEAEKTKTHFIGKEYEKKTNTLIKELAMRNIPVIRVLFSGAPTGDVMMSGMGSGHVASLVPLASLVDNRREFYVGKGVGAE